jgi:hypothetical protein
MPLRRVRSDSDILPTISASFTSPAPGTETYPTIVPSLTSLSLDASIVTSSSASNTPPASIGQEQTFTYKPLDTSVDSIRLLVLRGATSQESALSCSLLHTNFTEIPHYEALSCEWGSPLFTKSLQIDGANLRIGENLYEALVHIRLARHCILWIDAICTYVNRYQRKIPQEPEVWTSVFCEFLVFYRIKTPLLPTLVPLDLLSSSRYPTFQL